MDHNSMLVFGGFLLGISVSIMWSRLKHWNNISTSYGQSWGATMDVKQATRVFGYTVDLVENGKWNQSIVSLWRRNRTYDFFMMVTSETEKPKKTYLSAESAKRMVRDKAIPSEVEKIIDDWFNAHKVSS